jgi:hypothetical protein
MAAGPQLIKQEAECKGFTGFDLVLEGREASAALMSGSATSIHKDDQRQRLELVIFGRPGAEDHQPRERGGASASDLPSVRKPVVCRDGVLRAAGGIAVPWLALAAWRWRGQSDWAARLTAALNRYRPGAVRHAGHADMAPDPGVVGDVSTEVCRRSPCLLPWIRTPLTGCSLVYRVSGRSVRTAWTTCSIAALVSCA